MFNPEFDQEPIVSDVDIESIEDTAEELEDAVEEDFGYIVAGIDKLCREGMYNDAIDIMNKLSGVMGEIIGDIGNLLSDEFGSTDEM